MRIHMKHPNGNDWEAAQRFVGGCECYVLSNKNPLNHPDKVTGDPERGNEERFHVYVADERSVINGLQAGLSIRMVGEGNNGKKQNNLFAAHNILVDGKPLMSEAP